jgi:ATP-dependent RNA helicase RhlE
VSFDSLGLRAELLRAVSSEGYATPTSIQLQAIPLILARRDLLAGAQTGTGKTAGFTLPLLQLLSTSQESEGGNRRSQGFRPVRALILTPTRELAVQVEESVRTYGKYLPSIRTTTVFGGMGIGPQVTALRRGVDVVVATPGRLQDHIDRKTIDLSRVEILVLDEADRMLDMGFIRPIREILRRLPRNRQTLLFSATFSDEIRKLSAEFLKSPEHIQAAARDTAPELVSQVIHPVDRHRKRELLSHLIRTGGWEQVLVFTRTKHGADRLTQQLKMDGISSLAIHSNKSQGARSKALRDFKREAVRVLVATDIAARGLDIDQLPHVVNYELPHVPQDYLHRIGRTGRAGNEGTAVSLVCVDEHDLLRGIERLLRRTLPSETTRGFEPDLRARPQPIGNGRTPAGGIRKGKSYGPGTDSSTGKSSKNRGNRPAPSRRPGRAPGSRPGTGFRVVESDRSRERTDTREGNDAPKRRAAPVIMMGRSPRKSKSPSRRRPARRRA